MASPSEGKKPAMPKRAYKPNPVIQTRGAATKRRRDMFFNRVQNDRDDKKWESRREQVCATSIQQELCVANHVQVQQLDFVSERKRWEAAKARQAPPEIDDMTEEAIEDAQLPQWTNHGPQSTQQMIEADYVAAQEAQELQQLIASMEQENRNDDAASQHFGSDDEDYDELFMECATMNESQYQPQSQHSHPGFEERDAMDMDMTDG